MQRQARNLDGIRDGDILQQFAVDPMGLMFEAAITKPMTSEVAATIANGLGGDAP
ncbi:hypothetical protein D3C81_2198130 [compost metagenome]